MSARICSCPESFAAALIKLHGILDFHLPVRTDLAYQQMGLHQGKYQIASLDIIHLGPVLRPAEVCQSHLLKDLFRCLHRLDPVLDETAWDGRAQQTVY